MYCSRFVFNTQKSDDQINTEKYRNSTLIKKKNCRYQIASVSADTQNFRDRFWKNGIVTSLMCTKVDRV